jgi:N-methylhydantoinase A
MLAGRLRLDAGAARRAVAGIADAMRIDADTAAEGIIALATSHLEGAIRQVSVEAGEDPREYTLVAFGGAGPLHAGQLLRDLELPAVLVPRHPGLFSAEGLLAADLRIDDAWSVLRILDAEVAGVMAQWRKESQAALVRQLEEDGIAREAVRLASSLDCRYLGQGYELSVSIDDMVDQLDPAIISDRFQRLHRAVYGHTSPNDPVEAVTVRCSAFGGWAHARSETAITSDPGRETQPAEAGALDVTRPVRFRGSSSRLATPVFVRERLEPQHHVDGPAIISQLDTTIVVLPGQRASVDDRRNIWLRDTGR